MGNSSSKPEDGDKKRPTAEMFETPINVSEQTSGNKSRYPTPTGKEYDVIDKIAAELPNIIDEESKQQVQDYLEACDKGKGPVVACFAAAEYLSLFERKHKEAAGLFKNVCHRPAGDKSPNGVLVDGTKAYPAGCFNLAKMLMTGKGGIQYDRAEAYRTFDRACKGGHGGACHLQAQILCSPAGELGPGVPHNPQKAIDLYQKVCDGGDSISCFTLASMLLRGDKVSKDADNVSPQEARGLVPLEQRTNEEDRSRKPDDTKPIRRDPKRAEQLLMQACINGSHATSCHNLAVMYTHGDDGVPADAAKAAKFQQKTDDMVRQFGGFF